MAQCNGRPIGREIDLARIGEWPWLRIAFGQSTKGARNHINDGLLIKITDNADFDSAFTQRLVEHGFYFIKGACQQFFFGSDAITIVATAQNAWNVTGRDATWFGIE